MPAILRYNLITDQNLDAPGGPVMMPAGSTVLSAGVHPSGPSVWAMVPDPTAALEPHYFVMLATGKDLPADIEDQRFLATLTMAIQTGSQMKFTVEHVFEIQPHFALKHA